MSTSDEFRTHAEMTTEKDFIQALERLVSGNPAVSSSASALKTGVNRPLARLARNTDALLDVVQTNKNCFLAAGNSDITLAYTSPNLVLSGTTGMYIRLRSEIGGAQYNLIAPATLATGLSANKILYVQLNRTSNATITVSVASNWAAFVTAASNANRLDYMVLGIVTPANDLVLFNGTTIRNGHELTNALTTDSQYGPRSIQQHNRNLFLSGGGKITVDTSANTFTFTQNLKITGPSGLTTIPAATIASFTSGNCVHVNIRRTTSGAPLSGPTVGALSSLTIDKSTSNLFVIAYREGDITYLANGAVIQKGDDYNIDEAPVYSLTTTDRYNSASSTTIGGALDVKTSGALVAESTSVTSGKSSLNLRSRADNRQIFIRTTLKYNINTGTAAYDLTFGSTSAGDGIAVSHPDYGSGSNVYFNRIAPSSGVISFTANQQVAYVVLEKNTAANTDFTTVVANDHVSAGHAIGSGTTGNIYVCSILDVPESDADVFIFARRKDDTSFFTSTCILWDGSFMPDGKELITPGLPLDRAITSFQGDYYHQEIKFDWCRSGTADSNGNTTGGDRIAISWTNNIELHFPAGGVATISPTGSSSPVILNSTDTIAYVNVSLEDRQAGTTISTVSTTADINSLNSVSSIVLFSVFGIANGPFGSNVFPTSGRLVNQARNNPVSVFGGRQAMQPYEASGAATAATTGNVNLGRTLSFRRVGDVNKAEGLFRSSYPGSTNPFITSETANNLKVGTYSGAAFEGGSATFLEKFAVTASTGAAVSRDTVQATGYNYGDASGVAATKVVYKVIGAAEIWNSLGGDGSHAAGTYTTDVSTSGSTGALNSLYHDNSTNKGHFVHPVGTATGSIWAGKGITPLAGPGGRVAFATRIPKGSTLHQIRLVVATEDGGAGTVNDFKLRVSKNKRYRLGSAGTYVHTSHMGLLTDAAATVSAGGSDCVSATSVITNKLFGFNTASFDFTNAGVHSGLSGSSRLIEHQLDELWIFIGSTSSDAKIHLMAVEIGYTAGSVEGLLGAS